MPTFSPKLFLGVHLGLEASNPLDLVEPAFLALFVGKGDTQLKLLAKDGMIYLGKFLGSRSDPSSMQLVRDNIASMVDRLFQQKQAWRYVVIPWLAPEDIALFQL